VAVPPADWLGTVNHYRTASGLAAVTEEPSWSDGIRKHLTYLQQTPAELRVGEYANAHRENPASPWYTLEGDQAGRLSNLGWGSDDRTVIEGWMNAPFHAIGILRPRLNRAAFARNKGSAGLDVIRGLGTATTTGPVLFPANGSTNFLDRFTGESPDPTEPCGNGFTGLPLIAMLEAPPAAGTTATLRLPDGRTLRQGADLCVVTAETFQTTDPVYGQTGVSILNGARAVLVIPRQPLLPGSHQATVDPKNGNVIRWSFQQADLFEDTLDRPELVTATRWLAANSVTQGTRPRTFSPGTPVTRAQMAAFMHRFAGSPAPTQPLVFQDVPKEAYYASAVQWLAQTGVTTGTGPGTFTPVGTTTRAQMAAFLYRLAGSPPSTSAIAFKDVPADAYYRQAVGWLSETGVARGTAADTFQPQGRVSRGQMALFLERLGRLGSTPSS